MTTSVPSPVWIVGTGGHATVVASILGALGIPIAGYVDPGRDDGVETHGARPLLPGFERLRAAETQAAAIRLVIGVGDNSVRERLVAESREQIPGAAFPALVHPSSTVEIDSAMGAGTQVCLGAVVATRARLGDGVIVNSGAIVEHECVVGDYAHIAPGVRLAGRVTVGRGAHVGLGAVVNQTLTIGDGAIVGAGAVVTRDVPPGVTVVGVPARPVERAPERTPAGPVRPG